MRVAENIEHILGLKGAKVLADVEGLQVTLLAVTIAGQEEANILSIVSDWAKAKIKTMLLDFSQVKDAVFDWDGPGGVA